MVELVASTPGIFATLGVRIERGRAFDEHDVPSSERVAVVSALMEKQFTGGASLVGRSVTIQRRRFVGESVPAIETVRVIGIASDTDTGVVGRRSRGVLYLPFAQHYEPGMSVIVRAAAGVPPPVDALRRIVARTDPDLALVDSGDGITIGGAANLMMKVGAGASGLLGGLALLLAMAGLYGVLSDLVLRRKREIGVRMALGATRRELIRMIILDGTRPVIWGLAIGFGCGVVARMAFRPVFLRMLPAFDPLVLAIVPLPFIAAALLASYLPARRASRVDPNVALRHL